MQWAFDQLGAGRLLWEGGGMAEGFGEPLESNHSAFSE